MRLTLPALLALALASFPSLALADPLEFSGRLSAGGAQTHELPRERKGFWHLELRGPDGVDLDLRVTSGEDHWSSRGETASEELLVPVGRNVELVVDHYAGAAASYQLIATHVSPGDRLRAGRAVEGTVDASQMRYSVHELGSVSSFTQSVLDSTTRGVDLDLYLYDEQFNLLQSSTSETAHESFILPPSRDDRYLVVLAFDGSADYTLALEPVGRESKRLTSDDSVEGELTAQEGEQYYRLRTSSQGVVTIRLEGPDGPDMDLAIYGPDGYFRDSLANDSVEEIAINGARRGEYLIRVYPGQPGATGAYSLSTEKLELRTLARSGRGGSKVWGLFVGVADYLEVNDLSYTCGDALALYQELRHQGEVDTRHSIVLLDETATRAEMGAALDTIAERADEDDVFIFFYSGHGGDGLPDGARGDPADEADGDDEFLVCYDSGAGTSGDLIDDELREYLDRIQCGQQILLFDACFAGGFAELIDTDGRYGLFSSLETQTSNEAAALKAGLLTAILVRALTGEADVDQNGKVTLGELTDFVNEVLPNTCPSCNGPLRSDSTSCRACGRDLSEETARQIPVIQSRMDDDFVITNPGRSRSRVRR
jgi:Caspase domain